MVVAVSDCDAAGFVSRAYRWAHLAFPGLVDCGPIPAARMLAAADLTEKDELDVDPWGLPVDVVLATC